MNVKDEHIPCLPYLQYHLAQVCQIVRAGEEMGVIAPPVLQEHIGNETQSPGVTFLALVDAECYEDVKIFSHVHFRFSGGTAKSLINQCCIGIQPTVTDIWGCFFQSSCQLGGKSLGCTLVGTGGGVRPSSMEA